MEREKVDGCFVKKQCKINNGSINNIPFALRSIQYYETSCRNKEEEGSQVNKESRCVMFVLFVYIFVFKISQTRTTRKFVHQILHQSQKKYFKNYQIKTYSPFKGSKIIVYI